ncbi:uncharacterized protein PG986_006247 [Apiospora aurea]|uniref:Aminoglycoside phosphotransferase domain-containing protein n=1 Tax=Apiospora aurea TaxID=335848 RepID=A0ABR1QK23_9PEZI
MLFDFKELFKRTSSTTRRKRAADDYDHEHSLFVPKRRKIVSAIVIDDRDATVVKEENPPKTNLIPGSASPAAITKQPEVGDGVDRARSRSIETDQSLFGSPIRDVEEIASPEPEQLSDEQPSVGNLDTKDADDQPEKLSEDQPEVSDSVARARSRSIETDRSLFGTPTRDDEKVTSPEAEQLSDDHLSSEQPSAGDVAAKDVDDQPKVQPEVNDNADRSRSRSIETDHSLFGSPTRDDKMATPESEQLSGAQLPTEQPSAGDLDAEDVEDVDAMSISSSKSAPTYEHIGVEWETKEFDYFNPYPVWSCEPEVHEVVELLKEVVSPLVEYHVKLLHESAYNRFFEVEWDNEYYVLKLTVPVCPELKTRSEVATMRWTKAMTPLPLPDVVQNLYSVSTNNPIGCEWILMRKVSGKPLFECWNDMKMSRKIRLVEQLVEYTVRVYDNEFEGIGSLYPAAPGDPDQRPELKGVEATMPFFWNGRYYQHRRYGPYETYRDWAFDRLDLACEDAGAVLPKLENREIRKVPWRIQALVAKLKELHDVLFTAPAAEGTEGPKGATKEDPIDLLSDSEDEDVAEPAGDNTANMSVPFNCEEKCMLWHANLSMDNIFVDDTGVITGVLDWECVSAIPRSIGCQLPALLLEGHDRTHEPRLEHYWTFSDTIPAQSPIPSIEDDEDDEDEDEVGPTPAYWQARREWELTKLRHHFVRTMSDRSLGWHMCHKYHALKRDFETAVQYCDEPVLLDVVEAWVGDVEEALRKKRGD